MLCADVAMYRAKLAAVPFALYEHDFDSGTSRLDLADQLHAAIHSDQLTCTTSPSWISGAATRSPWRRWSAGTIPLSA